MHGFVGGMFMRMNMRLSLVTKSLLKFLERVATDENHNQELVRKIWHPYKLYDHPKLEQGITNTERSDNEDEISMTTCPHLERLSSIKLHQTMEHDPGLQCPSFMCHKVG